MDSAKTYEADHPCPSRNVVPQLADAVVRGRREFLLG